LYAIFDQPYWAADLGACRSHQIRQARHPLRGHHLRHRHQRVAPLTSRQAL